MPIGRVFPLSLRDVHAADRLVTILLRLQPFVQELETSLELLHVLLLRHAVHAYSGILADPVEGSSQRCDIDEMCERVEARSGFSFRSFRYLQQFW